MDALRASGGGTRGVWSGGSSSRRTPPEPAWAWVLTKLVAREGRPRVWTPRSMWGVRSARASPRFQNSRWRLQEGLPRVRRQPLGGLRVHVSQRPLSLKAAESFCLAKRQRISGSACGREKFKYTSSACTVSV